jgi:hypothetical protein
MHVVITHLTRMKPGFICVAGIDPQTNRQIRPVLGRCFTRDYLRHNGGPFEIGAEVDLGPTIYVGRAPAIEDHQISPANLRYLRRLKRDEFWSLLRQTSQPDLLSIFGPELQHQPRDHSATTAENHGTATLGHLRSQRRPTLMTNFLGRPRVTLLEQSTESTISLTDFRFCRSDHRTPRLRLLESVKARLRTTPFILAVGLTRPYQKSPKDPVRHWLQLNNIHLQDDPLGESLPISPDDDELWISNVYPPPAPKSIPPLTMAARAGARL